MRRQIVHRHHHLRLRQPPIELSNETLELQPARRMPPAEFLRPLHMDEIILRRHELEVPNSDSHIPPGTLVGQRERTHKVAIVGWDENARHSTLLAGGM